MFFLFVLCYGSFTSSGIIPKDCEVFALEQIFPGISVSFLRTDGRQYFTFSDMCLENILPCFNVCVYIYILLLNTAYKIM